MNMTHTQRTIRALNRLGYTPKLAHTGQMLPAETMTETVLRQAFYWLEQSRQTHYEAMGRTKPHTRAAVLQHERMYHEMVRLLDLANTFGYGATEEHIKDILAHAYDAEDPTDDEIDDALAAFEEANANRRELNDDIEAILASGQA
jgi:hypothetical protein